MIYGSADLLSMIKKDIEEIEQQKKIKVIALFTVSSLASGIIKYTTDYDIRGLFYYIDNPVINKSDMHNENIVRIKKRYESEKPYDSITFWEINSFFNFLVEPYLDQGYKYHLTRIVLESMQSPYIHDSIGLIRKIDPYFRKAYPLDNEIIFLKEQIVSFSEKENYKLYETIKLFFLFLQLKYINKYKEIPPVHKDVLLCEALPCEMLMYNEMQEMANKWNSIIIENDKDIRDVEIIRPDKIIDYMNNYFSSNDINIINEFHNDIQFVKKIKEIINISIIKEKENIKFLNTLHKE